MRTFFRSLAAVLLLAVVAPVFAAAPVPPCWPAQFGGTGTAYTVAWQSVQWRCDVGGKLLRFGFGWSSEFAPVMPAGKPAATPAYAAELWALNVGDAMGSPVLGLETDHSGGITAPPVVWVVAPLAGATSRPTSALIADALKPTGKRVDVGASCDCASPLKRGTSTWCSVAAEQLAVCIAKP